MAFAVCQSTLTAELETHKAKSNKRFILEHENVFPQEGIKTDISLKGALLK